MKSRDEWMEKLSQADMERLLETVDEADYRVDDEILERIRQKTLHQLETKKSASPLRPLRRLAAAVFVIAALSLLSPQVQATVRRLVSLIPGIGMVETQGKQILLAKEVRILNGESSIMGKPVILAGAEGVRLTIQVRVTPGKDQEETMRGIGAFRAAINGTQLTGDSRGMASGGEFQVVYQIFFEGAPKADDVIRITSDSLGIDVEGTLTTMDSQDPLTMAHGKVRDILVMADPVKTETGFDLYMYALSDQVDPVSFTESYDFDPELYFETETGERVPVETPTSYGTGFMPPLSVRTTAQKGHLVIPGITYSLNEETKYSFPIPKEDEVIHPTGGFTVAGFPITVKAIYRNPQDPDQIKLDLAWTNGQLSLDMFWIDGPSSIESGLGQMTVILDAQWSLTGRSAITIDQPELTWHEELRIPLDLTGQP